ncbi:phosphate transporter [Laetiporus sulphureus 93-53]|uniref:Phosphate transporter n=1 Tax=Laetiporus sulphureus 93-53 TaxID=1314785 RepID=A0A165EU50_9APHY|nr:phosphate transporter [Laetiporus sulphureus 93-53]KZT07767.1 phosphate transporter [Laetiporus sulphureus 93-53]
MATSPRRVSTLHWNKSSTQELRSHVVAPFQDDAIYLINERRRAVLAEIDNARFSWFHIKVAFVSGAGFFADAYDIFAINIVASMLGYVYGDEDDVSKMSAANGSLDPMKSLGVKIATPIGIIVGQLFFGWLGDLLGRKRIYGLELIIMIVGTFGQAMSTPSHSVSFVGLLIAWRFFMGIGIGGDYPLSAVISSEFSSTRIRGRVMTAVFANQGWGQLAATAVSCIAVRAYRDSLLGDSANFFKDIDQIWRIIIGFGCVPAVVALYFRLTIPETPRFTMDIKRNVEQAAIDVDAFLTTEAYTVDPEAVSQRIAARKATKEDFRSYFAKWENLKVLLGTAYSWFALDVAFYGLGLNSSTILDAIGFGSPDERFVGGRAAYENLKNISIGNLILSLAGFIPGYWAAFLVIDRWGRKSIQLMGFSMLTALLITMGFAYNRLMVAPHGKAVFVFLYCLANFFQNFGPNTTTFIIPGEVFPTRYRSTAHGISAASGKFGAVVAQVGFQWLKDIGGQNAFLDHILQIFGFFMLTGIFSTMLIPETNQRSLEALSNERQDSFFRIPSKRMSLPHAVNSSLSRRS